MREREKNNLASHRKINRVKTKLSWSRSVHHRYHRYHWWNQTVSLQTGRSACSAAKKKQKKKKTEGVQISSKPLFKIGLPPPPPLLAPLSLQASAHIICSSLPVVPICQTQGDRCCTSLKHLVSFTPSRAMPHFWCPICLALGTPIPAFCAKNGSKRQKNIYGHTWALTFTHREWQSYLGLYTLRKHNLPCACHEEDMSGQKITY